MKTQPLADRLRGAGFRVLAVTEGDRYVDGSVVIAARVHVQVPRFRRSGPRVVVATAAGPFEFHPARRDFDALVADLRLALIGHGSAIDRIVERNHALWRMLDESLPHSERLAALEAAFGPGRRS